MLRGRLVSTAPRSNQFPAIPIQNWQYVTGILYYHAQGRSHPEFLLKWLLESPADDTWAPLTEIFTSLDPFLFQFHAGPPKFSIPPTLKNSSSCVWKDCLAGAS